MRPLPCQQQHEPQCALPGFRLAIVWLRVEWWFVRSLRSRRCASGSLFAACLGEECVTCGWDGDGVLQCWGPIARRFGVPSLNWPCQSHLPTPSTRVSCVRRMRLSYAIRMSCLRLEQSRSPSLRRRPVSLHLPPPPGGGGGGGAGGWGGAAGRRPPLRGRRFRHPPPPPPPALCVALQTFFVLGTPAIACQDPSSCLLQPRVFSHPSSKSD